VSQMHYLPLSLMFFAILAGIFVAVATLIEIGVLRYAYTRLGIRPHTAMRLLLASLVGSYFNIPVARLPGGHMFTGHEVTFYGVPYTVPVVANWPDTVIAVNVGGALVPGFVSLYLLIRHGLWLRGLLAIAGVTAVCHTLARPVPGIGIALPTIAPAATAAIVALLLSRERAAPLAYISGSLGTLVGADLLNLGGLRGMGAPVASIGGAGTYDGIFLVGIMAVLFASLSRRARRPPQV
jgi:uncharacterized membrane protein